MKNKIILCGAVVLLLATFTANAEIIAGPITNPSNGHDYYLLTPNSWSESERQAENLGGTLAIINNAAEQEWVFSQFGAYDGANRNLWLGFHREGQDPFVSMMSEKMNYSNWGPGQPDNGGGVESCVEIWSSGSGNDGKGYWNDAVDWTACNGIVEVPGKSSEKALTEKEKKLIGVWYESGNREREAWIAGTGNKLFLITHDHHAAILIFTPEGFIFNTDRLHGEIIKDKILWSNGTWWSQKPSDYGKNGKSPKTDMTLESAETKK